MNTKNLVKSRKALAVIIGVALCAVVGLTAASASADSGSTQGTGASGQQQIPTIQGSVNLNQMILSNVKTKFSDAANTAASAVSNGVVLGGSVTVMQGYLVYNFKVIDDKNSVYSVIVDAGTGQVLHTSQGHQMGMNSFFGMGHPGMKMHKFHMNGYNQNSQKQQSSTENPTFGTQ